MPGTFPTLRTGAVAQYPLDRRIERAAEQLEFLSLARQVYRERSIRHWVIALNLLDASEVVTLREFFDEQRGRWGTFTFTDPVDASLHQCSFAEDSFPRRRDAAGYRTRLTIYEHP